MAHYLVYWKPNDYLLEWIGTPNNHSASNQYDRVANGDTLWIVTSNGPDNLVLFGRQQAVEIVDHDTACRRLKTDDLWEADFHAITLNPEAYVYEDISDQARRIGFQTKDDKNKNLPEGFTGRNLQRMRTLDADGIALLTEIWNKLQDK